MDAQNIIDESRLTHLRELRTAIANLKAENAKLREANEELCAHLDLAIAIAADCESLARSGNVEARLVIVDGWNVVLGAHRYGTEATGPFERAPSREELERQAREYLASHPDDFVWIVYDGAHFSTSQAGALRITYTGGTGAHRADRFVCDVLRMAAYRGRLSRIEVKTNDRDFRRTIERIRNKSCQTFAGISPKPV